MVPGETNHKVLDSLDKLGNRVAVESKIYFYRVYTGLDKSRKPIPFDPAPILTHINNLDWINRYLYDGDGKYIGCWIDQIDKPSKIRVGVIRRSNLPQVEESGNLGPLLIPMTSGLAEPIHVIIFDENIVGADYNFYGPRISKLADYMAIMAKGIAPDILRFEPLLRKDAVHQMLGMKSIRIFRLRIRSSYAETVSKANKSLGDAFKAAAEAGGADEVEIMLKPATYSRRSLIGDLVGTTKKLLGFESLHYEASKFYIEGYDSPKENIIKLDLLNDKFIAKKKIVRQDERSRALDPESAYYAIEEAYAELKDELIKAPSAHDE